MSNGYNTRGRVQLAGLSWTQLNSGGGEEGWHGRLKRPRPTLCPSLSLFLKHGFRSITLVTSFSKRVLENKSTAGDEHLVQLRSAVLVKAPTRSVTGSDIRLPDFLLKHKVTPELDYFIIMVVNISDVLEKNEMICQNMTLVFIR